MIALTASQERAWEYMRQCERAPSFREIAKATGLKHISAVHRVIGALERKGYVSRVGTIGRGHRMARGLIVHDAPQAALDAFSTDDLLAEITRRQLHSPIKQPCFSAKGDDSRHAARRPQFTEALGT